MIRVEKPKFDKEEWKNRFQQAGEAWSTLLNAARFGREALIKKFEQEGEVTVDPDLYKRFKDFLLDLFNGKCAYCETKITSNQPGDVEHFRPKGRVVDDNFRPIKVRHAAKGEIDHPGYYWLAYDWDNLFPSCIDCNRFRKSGPSASPVLTKADAGAGKADRFPLEDETKRAFVPDDECNESALLINPSEFDPDEHLEFCENGKILPKTIRGEATLKLFGLNSREDLLEARALAFGAAEAIVQSWFASIGRNTEQKKAYAKRINRMWIGSEPYTAMQRKAISKILEGYRADNIVIPLPLKE
jgi:hypothetical protein